MAINMGLTLISYLLVLITVCSITSQEHMSSEDINEILDQLIEQTKTNETTRNTGIMDTYLPTVDPQPGNDSNIYYFKTYMAPQIKYKTNNDIAHLTRRVNKTMPGVGNKEDAALEDEPFTGTNKMLRKSYLQYDIQKRLVPRTTYDRLASPYTEYDGENLEDQLELDNLINKEMLAQQNALKDNKGISFTPQAPQLNGLHNYPEIIIDHVTYDEDQTDKELNNNRVIKLKATHDRVQNLIKEEKNDKFMNIQKKPLLKTRFSIPEEEIQIMEPAPQQMPMEHYVPRNYLTPEIKNLIESIIQKKLMHEALILQNTENESRKQNMLLEKILHKLPDKNLNMNSQPTINIKSTFHHERLSPLEIERLAKLRNSLESIHRNIGHHLSKPYMKSLVRNKWDLENHLLGSLRRMTKVEAVKRSHYTASLFDKLMSRMDYQPVYYDVFRKKSIQ